MKRAMLTMAVVMFASFGAAYACGDKAKAHPAVATAEAKGGCAKADVAGKEGCAKADCAKSDCAKSDCVKGAAMVAKADGAAVAVEASEVKPCAGHAEGTGCAKKAKAVQVAQVDALKAVDVAENAK